MAASRFDTSPAFFTIEMAIWGTMIQHGSDFMRFYVATNPSVTLVVSTMGPFGAFQKTSNPGPFEAWRIAMLSLTTVIHSVFRQREQNGIFTAVPLPSLQTIAESRLVAADSLCMALVYRTCS
jgi:hypothetical protein